MSEELESILNEMLEEKKPVEIKVSNRPDLCDYQYDGTFALGKKIKKNPMEIGEYLVQKLETFPTCKEKFSKIECVRPGFINFTLSDAYINELLTKMANTEKFGITMPESETIIIDYGGANIAKPLHIGHLRPAIIGESIKRILKYMNQTVISDVHLGDYGLQIGQVIYGLKEENIKPSEITIEKLSEIYPKISGLCKEQESIKEICENITKDLQDGNEEYHAYLKKIADISKKDIKKMYDYLGVSFDLWLGESDAYKYIPNVTKELEEKNLLETSEGARIVHVEQEEDKIEIPPLIYQKSNGGYLYGTTDLATIYQRFLDFNPHKILYIADKRQNLHFTQVFRVAKMLDSTKEIDFEFLGNGTINGSDGRPFKTRAGNTPKLEALFEETKETFLNNDLKEVEYNESDLDKIVNSIIKFADLQNNREKEYIFDSEKFSKVTGKTGPYILYTYLRTKKIIKNNEQFVDNLGKTIYNVHDRNVRRKLLELDSMMQYAFKTRMSSVIASFLYDLCVLVNAFYENNHINNLEDNKKKTDWVTLLDLTTKIIENLLNLLVIEIPSKM